MGEGIRVDAAFALPGQQRIVRLRLPPGATVIDAIRASGLLEDYPEIDLRKNKVGVYGRLVALDTPLRDQDRVEIYRGLVADAKAMRRARAQERRGRKKGVSASD